MDKPTIKRLSELARLSQGLPTERKPDEIMRAEAALAKRRAAQVKISATGVEEATEEIPE